MSKFKKKILKNINVLNIITYVNRTVIKKDENDNDQTIYSTMSLIEQCPTKVKWAFRVDVKKLEDANKLYQEAVQEFEKKYIDDEHSYDNISKDENGNPVLDAEGNEIKIRSVKEEYLAEFSNGKNELLLQENEFNFMVVDIDDFGDVNLEYSDIEMLSFMIDEGE